MDNFTKKVFKNFLNEFEEAPADPFIYSLYLQVFAGAKNLQELNQELEIILKELLLIEFKNPVKELYY